MGVNGSNKDRVQRAWYPSGPRLDGVSSVGYEIPAPPPARQCGASKPPAGNPDPNNYRLLKAQEFPGYLLVLIQYPDCTNYEGKKILLFEKLTLVDLVNQKQIDPHFFPCLQGSAQSPIARFVPTEDGWQMATVLARTVARKE